MRRANAAPIDSIQAIKDIFGRTYGINITDEQANRIGRRLESLNLIRRVNDSYAGSYFVPPGVVAMEIRTERLKKNEAAAGIIYALDGGDSLWSRALKNNQFWKDLDSDLSAEPEESSSTELEVEIPAADRVVSITHNQFKAIDDPVEKIIKILEQDNGIPDEPGLKEQMLGQIRAGRELIRAGAFKLDLFRMTMIAGLQILVDRYKDHAIGAAASALLTVILHELGLPGF